MPANLTPEYKRAEESYRAAKSPEERLEALEEMLRVVPKHKGTDGLQADLKARISKLRKLPSSKAGKSTFSHMVPREGAGQVALVGPPNAGKSALVAALTRATPDVADYPFTTREATPGMMRLGNISIQLLDLPALSRQHVEPWVFDLVRTADLCWVVVDGRWPIEGLDDTLAILAERHIGLRPVGDDLSVRDLERVVRPALLVVTGVDRTEVGESLDTLDELLGRRWPICAVSTVTRAGRLDTPAPNPSLRPPPGPASPTIPPRSAPLSEPMSRLKSLAPRLPASMPRATTPSSTRWATTLGTSSPTTSPFSIPASPSCTRPTSTTS